MDQIRPFPPTDFIDQIDEEEAIRIVPASDLKNWVVANFLTLGGERQIYDDYGQPDKSAGFDHMNDAGTYPIAYLFPIDKKSVGVRRIRGMS